MSGTTGTVPLQAVVSDQLITAALWNSEFDNIGSLMDAAGIGGHSDTDADAQIQTAPYPGSVLSKATSQAGEDERLRYQIAQILGTDYWYKPAATNLTSVGNVVVPVGGVIDYPTNTAPSSSWHLADGTAISRAAYPALFTLIGTTFGIGDGTTTFNLPDYRDRMSIGAGSSYAAGATGGEATHVLTSSEIPSGLTVTDPGHIHSATDSGHTHGLSRGTGAGSAGTLGSTIGAASSDSETYNFNTAVKSGAANISVANHTTGISVGGGGGAHNNLPPYLGMFKMMRII